MDITVINTSLATVGILDTAESIIWTERFNEPGDFEIYTNFDMDLLTLLQEDYYLTIPQSGRAMIIESIEIKTTSEKENKLIVRGRTLESILDRRIILRQIQVDTTLQGAIQAILNADVISGVYPERNFPNFVFTTTSDPTVTALNLKAQFYSENLLDVLQTLCKQVDIGFVIQFNSSLQFSFTLYGGTDRSYFQSTNPYVVFSPGFDNLISSNYFQTSKYRKNYALVTGDPQSAPAGFPGYPLRNQAWTPDVGTGLNRREMFVDATDMPIYQLDSTTRISDADYQAQLYQRGLLELYNRPEIVTFDGTVDLTNSYKYRTDFFLGDILQLEDQFGQTARVRVTEFTFSENVGGSSFYPTLKTM